MSTRVRQYPAQYETEVLLNNTFALIAETYRGAQKETVGVARYYRLPGKDSAEMLILIEDSFQGKGLGTALMEQLANAARDNGINFFEADVSVHNNAILALMRRFSFHIASNVDKEVYHIIMPIARTAGVVEGMEERERLSTVASIKAILYPHSIAVIGAARRPGTLGHLLFKCLLQSGFDGIAYPVNPNAEAIMAVKTYPSVLQIPGNVDLGIIAVPAPLVAAVADECGQKGVRSIIVISDGFKEIGVEGAVRERELREIALGHGMRLVGPNCMGVINTDPAANLNATFSPIFPPQGNLAFLSQSGAMGLVILEYARSLNVGVSSFISVGNRADISSNDLLQYWEQDPRTKVILLYLESVGNPRKFARLARRVSAQKPIVIVKSGITPAGSKAAASHTGAMATSDVLSDTLFNQTGIIRVSSIEELFDVSTLLSNQPLPSGRRLVIVTNGGGPGIMAADASANNGLHLPDIPADTAAKLKPAIRRDIQFHNPLDTTAGASPQEFENILRVLAPDRGNDAVLAIFIPPIFENAAEIEEALRNVAPLYRENNKPLLACFMGQKGFKAEIGSPGQFVPAYTFPESAVFALAKAADYVERISKPRGVIPSLNGIERRKAIQIVERAMKEISARPFWLSALEVAELLNSYGIRFVETIFARTREEAGAAAASIGFPVAVKLLSPTITHKTDVGGVKINLASASEVERAFEDIKTSVRDIDREKEMEGVIVQRMVKGGIETIVGVTDERSFGPLIMFGMGGINAELVKDVSFRLYPLTDLDAKELITSLKMSRLFEGYRGLPPSDTGAIEELLLRVSALIEDIPQICDMDLNPVKVMPRGEGYWVVDARIAIR